MHILDPKRMERYVEHPLTAEEEADCLDRLKARAARFTNAPVTEQQEARWLRRTVIWQAEQAWLDANFPTGAVFSHMGVPVMVIGRVSNTSQPGPAHAAIEAHCAAPNGGLQVLVLEVPQLRAIVEPGYKAPVRDPLFFPQES